MKNYLYLNVLLLFVWSCMTDKGNYTYIDINEIKIDSIRESYTINPGDTLQIVPFLTFSLSSTPEMEHSWMLGDSILSVTPNLYFVPQVDYKQPKIINYIVRNKATSLQYEKRFMVTFRNPFDAGFYLLCEDGEKQASLSYIANETNKVQNHVFETINPKLGNLGSEPTQLVRTTREWLICCKGGDKNISALNLKTMEAIYFANEKTLVGEYKEPIQSSYIHVHPRSSAVVGNGKLFCFNEANTHVLFEPAKGDYLLADWVCSNTATAAYFKIGYDKEKQKFRHFASTRANRFVFDRISDFPVISEINIEGKKIQASFVPEEITKGQQFLAAGSEPNNKERVILIDDKTGTAYFYYLDIQDGYNPDGDLILKYGFSRTSHYTGNAITTKSIGLYAANAKQWYIATDDKIWCFPAEGGDPVLIHTLENKAIVSCLALTENHNRIAIGYYHTNNQINNGGLVYLEYDRVKGTEILKTFPENQFPKPISVVVHKIS